MKKTFYNINFTYKDRKEKAEYVWMKYGDILNGKVLDVGADECCLRDYLPDSAKYTGIGLGNNPNLVKINFEIEKIPFPKNSFDCVLCLDVLEHLDNIHETFDEICRVSKKWVIISLPNPWSDFVNTLRHKKYNKVKNIKFYGLTPEKEEDRHKWFFSSTEAQNFIKLRARKNKMKIVDLYIKGYTDGFSLLKQIKWSIEKIVFYRRDLNYVDIYSDTLWWVLEKQL